MDGEFASPYNRQSVTVTPETFFPSEPLNYAFRLFLWHYCRLVDGVDVVLKRGCPQLEIRVKLGQGRRRITMTLADTAAGVIVQAATTINEPNCVGMMQIVLLFMNHLDYPSYRLELTGDLSARFYTEAPTSALRTSGDFYDLIVRLAETASRLEQMDA